MTEHHDPEIIDLSGNYWASVVVAAVTVLAIIVTVGSIFPTQDANSINPVPWHSQWKAIFAGLLAGAPFGLVIWARAEKRLVIDDRAITLERVMTTRVIPLVCISSVQIVEKYSRAGKIIALTLFLHSGERVTLPAPDGGIDNLYIAICSRLPETPAGRSQAGQGASPHPRPE